MASFPYSVLRAKKVNRIRIIENTEEVVESKNIKVDFENQLKIITSEGLFMDNEDINFVISNMNVFYRNNLATILLTLNIRRYGDQFLSSLHYQVYFNYIARDKIKDEDDRRTFSSKLNFEIGCYHIKIQEVIDGMRSN